MKPERIKIKINGLAGLTKSERLIDDGWVVVSMIKDTVTLERK